MILGNPRASVEPTGVVTYLLRNRRQFTALLIDRHEEEKARKMDLPDWNERRSCDAMGDRLSMVFPLSVGYERLLVRTLQPVDTQVRFHWPGTAACPIIFGMVNAA